MMRQIGKQILTIAAAGRRCSSRPPLPSRADRVVTAIVTDPLTGVAIDGYDPVTYFTEPEPQPGKPDFEYYWGGVPWYFASAANRDVFMRAPEVYAPQYGGHCEMAWRAAISVGRQAAASIVVAGEQALSLLFGRQPRRVPARARRKRQSQGRRPTGRRSSATLDRRAEAA